LWCGPKTGGIYRGLLHGVKYHWRF